METRAGKFQRQGDKENSAFFEEYLYKIYARRESSGLYDLIGNMRGVLIQIARGYLMKYLAELYLMGPYRLKAAYQNDSHRVVILSVKDAQPDLILLEPNSERYWDEFTSMNDLFPRSREKIDTKYLGEIYQVANLAETVRILKSQEIRFMAGESVKNRFLTNGNFAFTPPSYFTGNTVGYTESDLNSYDALALGEKIELDEKEREMLGKADRIHSGYGFEKLVLGIDHLASRVFCNSREDAILEFVTMSKYYFWGAYTIEDQNSSTNICRMPGIEDELLSPAKVFTANNTPFYTETINGLPSPTENFVRNFGRRLHHMAYSVIDGAQPDGMKNIDYVVRTLASEEIGIAFLAGVVGECRDFPDLKQIFSEPSKYSILITEYVQRCHGFQGFFTKANVASLTAAAGAAEALRPEEPAEKMHKHASVEECGVCD